MGNTVCFKTIISSDYLARQYGGGKWKHKIFPTVIPSLSKRSEKKGIHSIKDSGYVPKKTGSSTNIIIQVNVTATLEKSWVFA